MTFITGVDFIAVPAKDFEESVRFYGETLGLPAGKRWGNMPGAEFQAGNLTLAIMEPTAFGTEFQPHSLPVAFQVDDVRSGATSSWPRAWSSPRAVRLRRLLAGDLQGPGGQHAEPAPPLRARRGGARSGGLSPEATNRRSGGTPWRRP